MNAKIDWQEFVKREKESRNEGFAMGFALGGVFIGLFSFALYQLLIGVARLSKEASLLIIILFIFTVAFVPFYLKTRKH